MAILWGYLFHCLLSSCSGYKLPKKISNEGYLTGKQGDDGK